MNTTTYRRVFAIDAERHGCETDRAATGTEAHVRAGACGILVVCFGLFAGLPSPAIGQLTGPTAILTSADPYIIFNDDSAPTYSWLLEGKDSGFWLQDTNGGGTIPFTVKPGSPQDSLYVDPNGVGIGTFQPLKNLHVLSTGSTSTLRLELSNIMTSRAWDLQGGGDRFDLVDVTNSNATPFAVEKNVPTNTLYLDSTGSVGIGTASPDVSSKLDVRSTLINGALLKCSTATPHYLRIENSAGTFRTGVQGNGHAQFGMLTPGKGLFLVAGGTGKMEINASGQFSFGNPPPAIPPGDALATGTGAHLTLAGVWTDSSSRAVKQDIEPITSEQARETVRALQPMTYRYKVQPEEPYAGFIAEDVPELVATSDRKSLAPMDFVAVLTKVVQDQDRELAEERQRNDKERQRSDKLERLVESLMQRVTDLEQQRGGDSSPAK